MRKLLAYFDRQDAVILLGLIFLAAGIALVSIPGALVVSGGLLFLVGVGWFMPKGGKS